MGEKYDGVRVCWNSIREKLYPFVLFGKLYYIYLYIYYYYYYCNLILNKYSRGGNSIGIPDNYIPEFFYNIFLDGELWYEHP